MIKLFEQFNNEQEIHDICKKYKIKNYTINPDGSVDVNSNVDLSDMNLTELPLKFNKVSGYFDCGNNQLTTLEGCPKEVSGSFSCYGNQLTTLVGCPEKVGGSYNCYINKLTSLDGYNGDYEKLYCDNKDGLILKEKRKQKLKLIENL